MSSYSQAITLQPPISKLTLRHCIDKRWVDNRQTCCDVSVTILVCACSLKTLSYLSLVSAEHQKMPTGF